MGDRPIDRVERPRDEGVYSSRIQKDKKGQEKFTHLPDDRKILVATFFSYLRKIFDIFSPSKNFAGKVIDRQSIIENLIEFKELLEALGQENLSNSAEYVTSLSIIWVKLLDDLDNIQVLERKNPEHLSHFQHMIEVIKNHPPHASHHFGYYLFEHAGKDWLPFPFIEILFALHQEHQKDAKNCTLAKWGALIDEAIASLKISLSFKRI